MQGSPPCWPLRVALNDLLGFTHYWGRKGVPVVKRKTSSSRLSRALKRIALWCQTHRHQPITEHAVLGSKGHYAYFGITGNAGALGRFLHEVERTWRRWLDRRSGRARMNWDRFRRVLQRHPLPPVRVVHSIQRSAAKP